MSAPAPVIDWTTAGMTNTALFAQIQSNTGQLVPLGLGLVGLSLALKYGKKIIRTVRGL